MNMSENVHASQRIKTFSLLIQTETNTRENWSKTSGALTPTFQLLHSERLFRAEKSRSEVSVGLAGLAGNL